jgi:hypothetical protein
MVRAVTLTGGPEVLLPELLPQEANSGTNTTVSARIPFRRALVG